MAGYAVVVSVLSHMSRPPVPTAFRVTLGSFGLHMVEFGVFAFLLFRALARARPGWSSAALVVVTVAATAGFGLLDEFHQSFIPGRLCEATDLLADTLGGAVAALLLALKWHTTRRRK